MQTLARDPAKDRFPPLASKCACRIIAYCELDAHPRRWHSINACFERARQILKLREEIKRATMIKPRLRHKTETA